MAAEAPSTIPLSTPEEGPNGSDPKEPLVDVNISDPASEDRTPDRSLENTSKDPFKQFVVQNFRQINAMYSAFSSKRKEMNPASAYNNNDHPVIEPWRSDSKRSHEEAIRRAPEEATLQAKPSKKSRFAIEDIKDLPKQGPASNADLYNKPFTFTETQKNVRNLVASPFTARIRDYDMLDGLKVPTNLKTYDGMTDLDDHLTVFMGTMDVHKLSEPAWCRFFHITLSGAARFWYDNLLPGSINSSPELRDKFRANFMQERRFQKTQAEILGIRQKSEESLKDYLARFGKETLHMTDRSDATMIGAFISGLCPGRPFKDLIAPPPTSLGDLYIHVNSRIRADEANNANRLRDTKE
ncbi:gag protein [Tanacetum coccineum]